MKGASCGCGKSKSDGLTLVSTIESYDVLTDGVSFFVNFGNGQTQQFDTRTEAEAAARDRRLGKMYRCKSSKGYFGRFKSIDDAEAAADAANVEEKNDADDWEAEEVVEEKADNGSFRKGDRVTINGLSGTVTYDQMNLSPDDTVQVTVYAPVRDVRYKSYKRKASNAFNAGYKASQDGEPRHSNPYPVGSPDNKEWDRGYMEGLPSGLD